MIDHVSIAVRDLERATAFYEAVLVRIGYARLEVRATTVGFGKRNQPGVSTVRTNTAQEAVELAEALTRSDEDIQFIDTPTDGRVGIDMLRVLAKEEAGEA